jgi:GGDEF domain-containing protein
MGLSKSFGSQAVNSVKLGKLHALPSTEDLLFVLATATQNKKMAELPCKNPHNNIDYTIKVVPATLQKAPRWTFERHTDQGTTVLWTRETNEVIMIQGKIKIDSNYSGAFYQEPAETDDQELDLDEAGAKGTEDGALSDAEAAGVEDEETTTEASDALSSERYDLDQDYETAKAAAVDDANRLDFQESHADEENAEIYNEQAGYEAGAGAENYGADNDSQEHEAIGHFGTRNRGHYDEAGDEAENEPGKENWSEGTGNKSEDIHSTAEAETGAEADDEEDSVQRSLSRQSHGDSREANDKGQSASSLPPAVVLHPTIVTTYLESMSDPATGLLSHGAFEFFLQRDAEYVQRNGKLSLLVFDFISETNKKTAAASTEAAAAVAGIITAFCTPLELCTQLHSGEFAILLCGYDGREALQFAERIAGKLAGATTLKSMVDAKALAIGVACMPETCNDPGTLVATASKAKKLARESRRNCMLFPVSKRRR